MTNPTILLAEDSLENESEENQMIYLENEGGFELQQSLVTNQAAEPSINSSLQSQISLSQMNATQKFVMKNIKYIHILKMKKKVFDTFILFKLYAQDKHKL